MLNYKTGGQIKYGTAGATYSVLCKLFLILDNRMTSRSSQAANGGLDWAAHAIRQETGCRHTEVMRLLVGNHPGIADTRRAIDLFKMQDPSCKVMVDNRYGEFVETSEPLPRVMSARGY